MGFESVLSSEVGGATSRYNVCMSADKSLRFSCPECSAELVIDSATGTILYHKTAQNAPAGGKTLESLMQGLEDDKKRAEDIFEREKAAMDDQDRLLEERFREVMSRVDEVDDETPPLRPFDLD